MRDGSDDSGSSVYFDDVRGEFVLMDNGRGRVVFDEVPEDEVLVMPELEDGDTEADEPEDELEGQERGHV